VSEGPDSEDRFTDDEETSPGTPAGRLVVRFFVLPLLVAREFHAFTFVFNGELEKPLHDPSRELASGFGFAFGRSFTRKVAAMIELCTESSIDFQRDRSCW